jgi:DNA helicase-2/ATP-dependent DNA helicase PcrA
MSHALTPEQNNFIEEWGMMQDIVLQARAGTGKTSTIIELAKRYPDRKFRVGVFNTKNAIEMQSKFPSNCIGSTWHTFCKGMFRINKIIGNIPGYNPWKANGKEAKEKAKENGAALREVCGLIKESIIRPDMDNVLQLIKHFGIIAPDPPEVIAEHAIKVIDISDEDTKVIDFGDMIRFPVIYDWISPDTDNFLGDEAQDNTPLRTHILGVLRKMGCQVGAVGDDRQSIYGFAGSDCDSMKHIIELGLKLMPLTTNFRCGKKIIAEAQKLVPDIQAWDGSPEGELDFISNKEKGLLLSKLISGDSIVARRNNEIGMKSKLSSVVKMKTL